jgi:hypothetical protein
LRKIWHHWNDEAYAHGINGKSNDDKYKGEVPVHIGVLGW